MFANVIGGVAVLALGIVATLLSRRLPYHSEYGPGPGFLPTWIGYVLIGCAVILTVQGLHGQDKGTAFFQPRTRLGVKVLVAIASTFLFIPLLGFAVSLGLFMAASMRLMGSHRWVMCGLAGVGTAVGIHYLFGRWLDIPLPTGVLGR